MKEARKQWERMTTNAIMDYIVVPALPRAALVEWQVWAHTHNDKFDCKFVKNHYCCYSTRLRCCLFTFFR